MVIALALGSALTFGAADFWGGLASRRAPSAAVVVTAQTVTFPVLLAWVFLSPATARGSDLLWGAVSGIAGAGGVLFLYKGLADGRMSVVAPLTGLIAASLPVLASPLLGEVPGRVALVGIVIALVAIALVSRDPGDTAGAESPVAMTRAAMVSVAVASGLCFGALFLLLDRTSPESGLWPLVANKVAGIALVGFYGLRVAKTGLRVPRPAWGVVIACAVAGTTAEIMYLLATQKGLVAVAAVLTSLYPGSTVLLARFVLHERLRPDQVAGFALAGLAVGLIALGGPSYAAEVIWTEEGPDATVLTAAFEGALDDGVVVAAAAVSGDGTASAITKGNFGPFDRFEIGSITKPITATLAAVLIGEGKLNLSDEIGQWLDAGPNGSITVEQLATHTSGLPRLAPNALSESIDMSNPYARFTADLAEEGLRSAELAAEPTVSYSNFGFQLLGLVLERASGETFDQLLRTRLAEPLGLDHTGVRGAQLPGNRVTGHSGGRETPHWDQPLPGAGGIESSITDMAKLARALLFPPDSALGRAMRLAQEPHVDGTRGRRQGLAWVIESDGLVWHNGGTGGFSSELFLDHDADRAVVLLANTSGIGDDLHRAGALAIRGQDPTTTP